MDSGYYTFAYTRLQEQDWAEVFIHAKKKHVDAAVGWMGYWFQAVGFRNADASWAPGLAYVKLDSDFELADVKPNIEATVGAFWPSFGYFEKYDTYTLGRFRQIGEQLKLTVPMSPDLMVTLVHGFGTNRDGSFNTGSPPFYGSTTALDLLTYANASVSYKNLFGAGIHFNTEWTQDPNLAMGGTIDYKSYSAYKLAHLTVLGAEGSVRMPLLGRLWISPSYINVRNGWALASAGTEVMHSLGGAGIASNYMGYVGDPTVSTGSGWMFNFGFLYENTLSGVLGQAPGSVKNEVTLNIFGLLTSANLTLTPNPPPMSKVPQSTINQFKWGADLSMRAEDWLTFMLRFDLVNYDLDNPGLIFASITPRATISSHYLSGERIYLQYSRYFYGDKMVLNGNWPWNAPLLPGANVFQQGPYSGKKPDENVVKLQAEIAF